MEDMVIRKRHKPVLGERSHFAKLNAENVIYIRESLFKRTRTIKQLSEEFSTSFQGIYHVAIGNAWAEVGGPLLPKKEKTHFTESAIDKIMAMHSNGMTQTAIALAIDAYQGSISKIIRRMTQPRV
jgi:hypothetical protein